MLVNFILPFLGLEGAWGFMELSQIRSSTMGFSHQLFEVDRSLLYCHLELLISEEEGSIKMACLMNPEGSM